MYHFMRFVKRNVFNFVFVVVVFCAFYGFRQHVNETKTDIFVNGLQSECSEQT